MKRITFTLSIVALLAATLHAAAPVVSNLSASQRAGTKLVDIVYDVAADTSSVDISLEVSSDGGSSFTVPATSLSGAIGAGVRRGHCRAMTNSNCFEAGRAFHVDAAGPLQMLARRIRSRSSMDRAAVSEAANPSSNLGGSTSCGADAFEGARHARGQCAALDKNRICGKLIPL